MQSQVPAVRFFAAIARRVSKIKLQRMSRVLHFALQIVRSYYGTPSRPLVGQPSWC